MVHAHGARAAAVAIVAGIVAGAVSASAPMCPVRPCLAMRGGAGMTEIVPPGAPSFVRHRLEVLERVRARAAAAAGAEGAAGGGSSPIVITLPDGTAREGEAGVTTPLSVAEGISKQLASVSVVAQVDGELWDLSRALTRSCSLELLPFDDARAQAVFWHSSAHILGQALELSKGALLVTGPATDEGFFYDVHVPHGGGGEGGDGGGQGPDTGRDSTMTTAAGSYEMEKADNERQIATQIESQIADSDNQTQIADSAIIPGQDLTEITGVVSNITRQKQPFERIQLTKEEAMEMFSYNPFKQALIRDKVPDGATCTAYKCGPLIDLCRGPHVPHTGFVKAFSLTKNSGAYWKGCARNTGVGVGVGVLCIFALQHWASPSSCFFPCVVSLSLSLSHTHTIHT